MEEGGQETKKVGTGKEEKSCGLKQAYFLCIFKKLKAQKTQPLKKLKAIFCRKTQYVGIF